MTPQTSFMILATIIPDRETDLRRLLAAMNLEPGSLDPLNFLVPFGRFHQLHFARFVILDDDTVDDIRSYGLPSVIYPTYLAFLGDIDGTLDDFLAELAELAGDGLRRVFSYCKEYGADVDLLAWLKARRAAADYVNWVGRTVQQVHEEEALRQAIESFLQQNSMALAALTPRQVNDALRKFIAEKRESSNLILTPEAPTPLGWRLRNLASLL